MPGVIEVSVPNMRWERFHDVMTLDRFSRFEKAVRTARKTFENRVVWNVNSTATGGGVAEMLRSLLAYARGARIDVRWVVIPGNPEFFHVTKRIHNNLHGAAGDGGDLGAAERAIYETSLADSAEELAEMVGPGDIVLVHDPQPAGLITALQAKAAVVLWRCHVGLDLPNELARRAWSFLIPYISEADAFVFSRKAFAWEGLDSGKIAIVPPSIDAFSPKNQDLPDDVVDAILATTRLVAPPGSKETQEARTDPSFLLWDGTEHRVHRPTELYGGGRPAPADARLVVQVSRWDRLKDPVGVIEGFARHTRPDGEVHLVVAGPAVEAVADDPEGAEVLEEAREVWSRLDDNVRERIHLACIPMDDGNENAAIVNALQRRATIAVQKSLAEGFGLTVAEAMWKARPVVASRIGGIQDQIEHGRSGILIDDPTDLPAYGAALERLLSNETEARAMGREAQSRVRDEFLGARHLMQYLDLIGRLLEGKR